MHFNNEFKAVLNPINYRNLLTIIVILSFLVNIFGKKRTKPLAQKIFNKYFGVQSDL